MSEFFYKPHTISLMFFCVLGLTYTAFTRDDSDWHNNILTGLVGVLVLFMIISILTLPNGPFTRPHPALWRCVLGVSILYLLLVQFLLHQVRLNLQYYARHCTVLSINFCTFVIICI